MSNALELCGRVANTPVLSHESHGILFYSFALEVRRLSGAADVINVLAERTVLDTAGVSEDSVVRLTGELRSFNDKSAAVNRLKINAYARTIEPWAGEHTNSVCLTGTLCRAPIFRQTPYGREIADMVLSVPRIYAQEAGRRRADYIPCIAWGATARICAALPARTQLTACGRIQSRRYIKVIGDESFERTAFELSLSNVEILENME